MAELHKRFPYRMLAGAVLLVIVAAVLAFVETVGRRGTLVARYERLLAPTYQQRLAGGADMEGFEGEISESDVVALLGSYTDCRDKLEGMGWPLIESIGTVRNRFGVLPEEPRLKTAEPYLPIPTSVFPLRAMRWEEGPVEVTVVFSRFYGHSLLEYKGLRLKSERFTWWHLRRWAEMAWTAIHGSRR